MTPEEMRARDISYRRQRDEYRRAFDPLGQHEVRASLTDSRCTCPAYWRGVGERPRCTEHEQEEK